MAIDPTIISAGVGLLGSLFGGRRNTTPSYVAEQYNLRNAADRRAMDLYDRTNLEETDARAVESYRTGALQSALAALNNYDAQAAGRGSSILKADTAKERSRNQIAADAVRPVSEFAAGLETSRANRKAQLLPNVGGNMAAAQYLDNFNLNRSQANADMWSTLMQIAARFANRPDRNAPQRNDRDVLDMDPFGANRGYM
jgi:hypothetical protein